MGAPWLYYIGRICEAFPGWSPAEAEAEALREQEQGWPIRGIMTLRGFARMHEAMKHAAKSKGAIRPPTGPMAEQVALARKRYNEQALWEFKGEQEAGE